MYTLGSSSAKNMRIYLGASRFANFVQICLNDPPRIAFVIIQYRFATFALR